MRRKNISPEFTYNKVNGTLSMLEESSFFGSKMLAVDDNITISNDNLVYYQSFNREQINLSTESSSSPIVYNTVDSKNILHTIKIDETQTQTQLDDNTRWIMEISLNELLRSYLFATVKKYRTFEGIKNSMSIYNDIDASIYEYIDKNILNRYKFKSVDFFISYNDLKLQNILRFKNVYTQSTENSNNIFKKIQTDLDFNSITLKLLFSQEKPSTLFSFNYYFNLFFERI
jgi:hypothetical protein